MQQFPDEFMHLLGCKWWAGQIKVECNGHVMGVRQRRVLTFAWKRPRCGFYPTACIPANTTLSKLSTHIILSILSVPTDTALNYQYFCSNNTGVIQDIWHIGWSCGYIGQTNIVGCFVCFLAFACDMIMLNIVWCGDICLEVQRICWRRVATV